MAKFFSLLFLTALIFQFGNSCRTDKLTPRVNLDLKKLGGDWYRIDYAMGKREQVGTPLYKCFSINFYVPQGEKHTAIQEFPAISTYTWLSTGEKLHDSSTINIPNSEIPAVWNSTWDGMDVEHVVLAVDEKYSEWYLYYGCQHFGNSFIETLALQSRSRTIDPKVRQVLRDFGEALSFPRENIIEIDQNNC